MYLFMSIENYYPTNNMQKVFSHPSPRCNLHLVHLKTSAFQKEISTLPPLATIFSHFRGE